MKVLGPKETGKGILIEYDAGFVSPDENKKIISEMKNLDFSEDIVLYAVLQKFDTPNKNGRIYPESILKREMEKYKGVINKGSALNELNHPSSSLIDLDRVSHVITETWWDGKILMGKLKLLTSPGWKKMGIVSTKGDQAAMLLQNGVTLGISSRGVGSLKKVGEKNEVQDDFELICFDLVSSPSTPGAYLFLNPEDRNNFEENIEEEKKFREETTTSSNKSLDLMRKLNDYLGNR